ncbi:MAG TPA: SDR family oxidoreductase [Gryllotalpicola sp.]
MPHHPTSLVTGAASGIGKAIATRLAARGDHVVVLDRDVAAGESAVAGIVAAGGSAEFRPLDLVDLDAVRGTVDAIAADRGGVDVLINNAGVAVARPFGEYTARDWALMFDINVRGAFFMQQAVVAHMRPRGAGRIVNIASTAAFVSSSTPESIYDMTKAAVKQLTISSAVELAPLGINVNAVAPGTIATDLTLAVLDTPEKLERAEAKIPARRLGAPEDIAAAVAFLTSADADYVHGHVLVVDGGWLLE